MTEPVTESVAETPGLPGQKPISKDNTEEKLSELLDGVRVTSPDWSEDLESLRKNRNDSGCSYSSYVRSCFGTNEPMTS